MTDHDVDVTHWGLALILVALLLAALMAGCERERIDLRMVPSHATTLPACVLLPSLGVEPRVGR
jgi:hypothetical protein